MPQLYALLAGVDRYHPNSTVPALSGCENDIRHWQDFLESRFPAGQGNIIRLLNEQATYANVVGQFGPAFLQQAGKGDTVLFAYSGHGSREGAAPQFDAYYPEGLQETLVLYDSRAPGGLDLADKELAVLIERIARQGAHVSVVLDCCHAGSGTRALEDFTLGAARHTADRASRRAFDSYLGGAFAQIGGGFYLPSSRHLLMAACDRSEKAWETTTRQGLFSATLMRLLDETGGRLSYADLYQRCRLEMAKTTDKQHPQFEPSGFFNGYDGFLGLQGASSGAPLRIFFDKGAWQASMGAVHGLPVGSARPAQFELLKDGQVLGQVKSRMVGAEQSSLETPDFPVAPGDYEGRLLSMVAPKLIFELRANAAQAESIKTALSAFGAVHFDLQAEAPQAACRMEVDSEQIQLVRPADGLLLRNLVGDDWDAMLQDAFAHLEHIAQWERSLALDNQNTAIQRDELELTLVELNAQGEAVRRISAPETVIDIPRFKGVEQPVPFLIEVTNKSGAKPRHCALFYASGDYGLFPVGFNERVLPGTTVLAMDRNAAGKPFEFVLNGKQESWVFFKLFVSNSPLSGEGLAQARMVLGARKEYWRSRSGSRGLGSTKDIGGFGFDLADGQEDINDWYCLTLRVKCVAREASVGSEAVALAGGAIRILPHASLRADLALTTVSAGGRSLEAMSILGELAQSQGLPLLGFGQASRGDAELPNMLELTDIEGEDSLQSQPLEIELDVQLQDTPAMEELLLPLTFDGQHILPIGQPLRLTDGKARVSISHLPAIQDTRRRSLGKALKLCFLKLVLKKEKVCELRWVDYSGSKALRRSEDLSSKVQAAGSILLLLHGIIGDTEAMAAAMRPLVEEGDFDLVLTFDYENLNTPIEETAVQLERLLRETGIIPGSDKRLSLLAHSMGGLVARYFIEKLGGRQVVQYLIMAGTPNGGSAIAKLTTYRDYAIPLLSLLVNLPWGIPAAATLMGLLQQSKSLTVTLAQMDGENSPFLKLLNTGEDPGLPYLVLAGDLNSYLGQKPEDRKLLDKAYELGGKAFYGDTPNDIAVSVDSIKAVPAGRMPAPVLTEVPCHHLNYFEHEESLMRLMAWLKVVGGPSFPT